MYLGRRLARIRTGSIHPDVKPEWIVVTICKETKLEHEVVNKNRIKTRDWWGYGLEIFLRVEEKDLKGFPYIIVCKGKKLNTII